MPSGTEATPFPFGGLLLLLALLAIACWAWWAGARRSPGSALRGWPWRMHLGGAGARVPDEPVVAAATRLDASTRLYVVRWHDRELLLGLSGNAPPVVLDRQTILGAQPGGGNGSTSTTRPTGDNAV